MIVHTEEICKEYPMYEFWMKTCRKHIHVYTCRLKSKFLEKLDFTERSNFDIYK